VTRPGVAALCGWPAFEFDSDAGWHQWARPLDECPQYREALLDHDTRSAAANGVRGRLALVISCDALESVPHRTEDG
jgi:hypothetical protein